MITGFTITALSPSPIPRHTSSSPKYLLWPYTLLLVSSVQFIFSVIGSPSLIRPNAATELTCTIFLIPAAKAAFTTLAVPSILIENKSRLLDGAKLTIAAQ